MRERLTKNDVEKIQAEIEHRKLVERKELIEAVKEARSHGDLSENFEYHAAKKAKNQNESRIRYLTWCVVRLCKGTKNWDSPKSRCGKAGRRVGVRPAFPRLCLLDALEEEFREF